MIPRWVIKFAPLYSEMVARRLKTLGLVEAFKRDGKSPQLIKEMPLFCSKCLCFHPKMKKWEHRRIIKKKKRLDKYLKITLRPEVK